MKCVHATHNFSNAHLAAGWSFTVYPTDTHTHTQIDGHRQPPKDRQTQTHTYMDACGQRRRVTDRETDRGEYMDGWTES